MTQQPLRTPVPAPRNLMRADEERTWAAVAHASGLAAALLSAGWLSILGPLAVYLYGRNRSDFVRRSAARAFNFTTLLWLLTIAGWVLAFTVIGIPVALLIWLGIFLASVLFHLVAALHAWRGELYRYPWSLTLLR
jgi:uncharacterized Tic20 family protein